MKVLVGCEESGVVREAFRKRGHNAWSCDLVPSRQQGQHIQANILDVLNYGWDLAIFHTPCTYLSNSGVHWLHRRPERWELMRQDALLFKACMDANIPMIANENPIMHKYAIEIIGRKHDQLIQPWMFGEPESKATCLWLKNLPRLVETNRLNKPKCGYWNNQTPSGQNKLPPSPTRQRDRSVTYQGIADAMATQWSAYAEGK